VTLANEMLVFMLEEPSAKEFLDHLLPELLPPDILFQTIPHRGKHDLQKSLPRKLRAWQTPARFVVLHDQDSNDCEQLKEELQAICREAGREDTVVRIACRELEAWYFGDLAALQTAFPKAPIKDFQGKVRYRDPDAIQKPSAELESRVQGFQKGKAARTIPEHMDMEKNRSHSFNVLIRAVERLGEEIASPG